MSLTLNAWWKPRPETADACAEHLQEMLVRLTCVHPVFNCWKKKAKTKKDAQKPFCAMPPEIAQLRTIVAANIMRDDSNKPWPELGYRISAWNELDKYHGLFFHAGVGAWNNNVPEPNNIFFQLGNAAPANEDLLNYCILRDILIAVTQSWGAEWATIERWDDDRRPKDEEGNLRRPWGGWITYLSPTYARLVMPPAAAINENLSHGGLLIAVTKDQFILDDPAQTAVYDAVQACLRPLQK